MNKDVLVMMAFDTREICTSAERYEQHAHKYYTANEARFPRHIQISNLGSFGDESCISYTMRIQQTLCWSFIWSSIDIIIGEQPMTLL